MEPLDGRAVLCLEGEVQAGGRLAVRAHEELVCREPAVSLRRDPDAERFQRAGVEALARVDVPHPQVHVVDEPARM